MFKIIAFIISFNLYIASGENPLPSYEIELPNDENNQNLV